MLLSQLVAVDPGLQARTDVDGFYRIAGVPAAVGAVQVAVGEAEGRITSELAYLARSGVTELKGVRVHAAGKE